MEVSRRELFNNKYKYRTATRSPKVKGIKLSSPEEIKQFKDYVDYLKEKSKRLDVLITAKFLGRYSKYIEYELAFELERLNGTTMMVHSERSLGPVSTRGTHVYNASEIAHNISIKIFNDEEIARGIGFATLLHDLGQPAFGHGGENISSKVSNKKQGGPRPHNATGAAQILFRNTSKIKRAINNGIAVEIISTEAMNRNISAEDLSKSFKDGKEKKLEELIDKRVKELEGRTEEAIKVLTMSAGTHNGERGTANIIPTYKVKFDEFYRILEKCFIYDGADKEMQSTNIIDAIVKISDQISSIPYDMIDGKKGGLVIDIPESYLEPISKILGIDTDEALRRIRGDNNQLNKLVMDIQEKLVASLVKCSDRTRIKMDMDSLLYGKKDKKTGQTIVQGLRMPTYGEYLPYTASEEEINILQEAWYNCTEQLASEILGPDRMFSRKLNAIFRMEEDDPRKPIYQESLRKQYNGREEFKGFMDYILETTPEEYKFIKANCHEYGVNIIREKIKVARDKFMQGKAQFRNDNNNDIEQEILNYIFISSRGIPEPENGVEYTDEEINSIYKSINSVRSSQGKKKLLLERDERIATQLALGYIEYTFDDKSFIDFCVSIGAMTEEQANIIRTPYDPVSKSIYIPDSVAAAAKAYAEAEREEIEPEI